MLAGVGGGFAGSDAVAVGGEVPRIGASVALLKRTARPKPRSAATQRAAAQIPTCD